MQYARTPNIKQLLLLIIYSSQVEDNVVQNINILLNDDCIIFIISIIYFG